MCRDIDRQHWHERAEALARRGLRVLALAERVETADRIAPRSLEDGLTFLGLVGLIDPPRPEAIAAVAECRAAGIRVKMITGDHAGTARAISREMGLVAVGPDPETGKTIMYGVVRITADPDNVRAEYAVMVRSDMKGQGLGYLLMSRILEYARSRGIKEVYGEVLRENTNMLGMCRALGFVRKENLDEPGVVEVRIDLEKARQAV